MRWLEVELKRWQGVFFFFFGVIGGVGEKLVGWVAEEVGRGSR